MEALLVQNKRIRGPVVAGMYYPEYKREMLDYIKKFGLVNKKGGFAQAIIAPHGAWDFSGALAARAFLSAMGRGESVNRVVILGPIHDKREKGIFLSNSHSFCTPLGNIPVDLEKTEEFEFTGDYFETNDIPHLAEHSIEILLPFVKYCFPHASIVPILMGESGKKHIRDLAVTLKSVIGPVLDETLLVVSSNLSCDRDKGLSKQRAMECQSLFCDKNAVKLTSAVLDGSVNACGGALVAGLLESGLLNNYSGFACDMVSAVGTEENTVFYNSFFYE